jgi:hypothetical protein
MDAGTLCLVLIFSARASRRSYVAITRPDTYSVAAQIIVIGEARRFAPICESFVSDRTSVRASACRTRTFPLV